MLLLALPVDFNLCCSTEAAEPLPDPVERRRKGKWVDADILYADSPWLMEGEKVEPEAGPGVLAFPESWNAEAPVIEQAQALTLGSTARVLGLPVRHLPHQRLSDLYWLFQGCWQRLASCLTEEQQLRMKEVPAFRTFQRHWKRWRGVLRFRKPSQHAQCQTCAMLLHQLHRRGAAWADRAEAAAKLKQHYQDQYLDRCLYWSLRFASRSGQDALFQV